MNITGRLTGDAEVRTLKDDRQVVNFSIAVNDSYKNKQGDKVTLTEYFSCAYWRAAKVAQFLTKGTLVELSGWVSTRAWTASNGEARATLTFQASEIKLHGSASKSNSTSPAKPITGIKFEKREGEMTNEMEDDLPF